MDGNSTCAPQLPRPVPQARTNSLSQASAKGSSAVEIDVLDHISKMLEAVHPAKPKRVIAALPRRSPHRPSPSSRPSQSTEPHQEQTPTLNRNKPPSRIKQSSSPQLSINQCTASVSAAEVDPELSVSGIGTTQNEGHSACLSAKEKGSSKLDGIPEPQAKDSDMTKEGDDHIISVDYHLPNAERTKQVREHRTCLDTQPATPIPSLNITSLPPEGLTEEQLDMTIQQFIETETQRIYETMKRNGERLIQEFIQEGKRQRAIIVSHLDG